MNKITDLTRAVIPHDIHWAIEPNAARAIWRILENTDAVQHVQEYNAARASGEIQDDREYEIQNGVAIITMRGAMTKAPTSFDPGCSTVYVRRLIRQAASDKDCKAILLLIDSPGGSVSGTADLATDVANAARQKFVLAYAEDTCCSAAYWVASQASMVLANKTALIGSLGTYMVVDDFSKMYENAGVQVHVISTGKYKGAGVQGSEISDDHLTDFQRTVDELNTHFMAAIRSGRSISADDLSEIADGRVFIASEAANLGLIDGVASYDQAVGLCANFGKNGAKALSQYDFVSSDSPLIGMSLEAALDSALIAAREVAERVEAVKTLRDSQGRKFSQERLNQVRDLHTAFGELLTACESLGDSKGGCVSDAARDALRERLSRSLVSAALSEI